ncbi:hypothetical protein E4T56_gene4602 [Termitomyces sp. T112]|nr:hypothetical protein E4T56_gene4602 [Termitomyces sp. T112]KAH0589222.1 hypothetical protein H2248_004984 [Termitomyces sp. 'cryptogamus']
MRQSVTANRVSHGAFLNSQTNFTAAAAKLLEKKKEYDAVSALERATALYLERIEGLSEDCNVMADAGEAHGQVLEQWPKMFRILSLFLATRNCQGIETDNQESDSALVEGQRLVRIPIEELQQASSTIR